MIPVLTRSSKIWFSLRICSRSLWSRLSLIAMFFRSSVSAYLRDIQTFSPYCLNLRNKQSHTCSSKSFISRDKLPESFTNFCMSEQSVCNETTSPHILHVGTSWMTADTQQRVPKSPTRFYWNEVQQQWPLIVELFFFLNQLFIPFSFVLLDPRAT